VLAPTHRRNLRRNRPLRHNSLHPALRQARELARVLKGTDTETVSIEGRNPLSATVHILPSLASEDRCLLRWEPGAESLPRISLPSEPASAATSAASSASFPLWLVWLQVGAAIHTAAVRTVAIHMAAVHTAAIHMAAIHTAAIHTAALAASNSMGSQHQSVSLGAAMQATCNFFVLTTEAPGPGWVLAAGQLGPCEAAVMWQVGAARRLGPCEAAVMVQVGAVGQLGPCEAVVEW